MTEILKFSFINKINNQCFSSDTTPELLKTRALIEENLQIKGVIPYAERVLLRDICRFVR